MWPWAAVRWLSCTFREVMELINVALFPTAGHGVFWDLWKSFSDHCSLWYLREESAAPLFKCLLLSRGWKYLWCESMPQSFCSLSVFLGAVFLRFETMKVHNRNVQLTVKHSHQFRDHFQIWWMSSKYSIHSNHQAEKQSNSWGKKSRLMLKCTCIALRDTVHQRHWIMNIKTSQMCAVSGIIMGNVSSSAFSSLTLFQSKRKRHLCTHRVSYRVQCHYWPWQINDKCKIIIRMFFRFLIGSVSHRHNQWIHTAETFEKALNCERVVRHWTGCPGRW